MIERIIPCGEILRAAGRESTEDLCCIETAVRKYANVREERKII